MSNDCLFHHGAVVAKIQNVIFILNEFTIILDIVFEVIDHFSETQKFSNMKSNPYTLHHYSTVSFEIKYLFFRNSTKCDTTF